MAFSTQLFHLFCFALVLGLGHWASQAISRPLDHEQVSMRERHEQWMAKYGRVYKDEVEKEKRFSIFMENVKRIEEFNNNNGDGKRLYKLGVNAFTDLTLEEFQATRTGYKRQTPRHGGSNSTKFRYAKLDYAPQSSMDWREMGAVTPIKDQGACGCCWAFSSVAAIEGLNQIKTGQLIPLSEQELVDCSNGCQGNAIDNAFRFIQQNQGLTTEDQYPYTSSQGIPGNQCQSFPSSVMISGYEDVPNGDENALMQAVSQQPVAVTVNSDSFMSYSNGIFDGPCGTNLNHAVTVIGYGTDPTSGQDYWLIKNSWGESWGEGGFMRMLRGQNICSVASVASYPTM